MRARPAYTLVPLGGTMRRGGPHVTIALGPGGQLTAQLHAVVSPGGPVSRGGPSKP